MSLDVSLVCECCDTELYGANITHNLNQMASAAGAYEACWRPDENGITRASQLTPILRGAIGRLEKHPELFKQFNPSNGWGNYEGLVEWLSDYADACEKYPNAIVEVSR